MEGGGGDKEGRTETDQKIDATTNLRGLIVEGRGGDALSVRLNAEADGPDKEGGTGGNSRVEEEGEERVDSRGVEKRVRAGSRKNRCNNHLPHPRI